jgi:adenylate cyclase
MALFIGLLAQYLLERHKVQHISEAISQYVPENVSRELASMSPDPSQLNKVTYSTCLATDMAGFSTIAETLKPGELAAFLNDYFDSLAQPLRNHHVDVTEFRADAIMCAWTGDTTDINVRRNPILASLEASDAIERFKQRHAMFGASLRIGMEAGEVYVGHAGGGGHFVYSIVGDCANTASRIEGLNKHIKTQILATQAIVDGIDDLLLRDLGGFRFVGKTEPLPIVEILALEDKATDEQKALCERFAEGMAIYRKTDWQGAAETFEAILGDYPDDGPASFYLEQCRERINHPPPPDDPCTINMTKK